MAAEITALADHPRQLFDVLHEDADLLVVHKPADLVCHPTKGDEYSSLISRVRIYLGVNAGGSPANRLQPHLIHRLDRETSGVVLIAKNTASAGQLGKIWETRAVRKEYLAIVHGHVAAAGGIIDAPLGKDDGSPVAIKDCVRPDGSAAQTEFAVEKRFFAPTSRDRRDHLAPFTLLGLHPLTGRKHPIRIHLAHIRHPIVGDKLYGGDPDLYLALVEKRLTSEQRARLILPHQALHANRLDFPWHGKTCTFSSPPEAAFAQFVASGIPA